jgi:8-oxo-dGTP pyrophosphatase MutT (NUDIX family)
MDVREKMQLMLRDLVPRPLSSGYSREAAVLMPVFHKDGEPHFLLTRRTHTVETHKGQISFPGGMRDPGEELEATALRETLEEVGIEPAKVEVLGRFHEYLAVTNVRVVPFVGHLAAPPLARPQPREVAEILEVPFAFFRDRTRLRVEPMERRGRVIDVYFYDYGPHEIWGLTARIIRDFLFELDEWGEGPV